MEQKNSVESGPDNRDRNDQQADIIPPATGVALAVIVFLVFGSLTFLAVHHYIPDNAKRAEVFLASMFSLAIVIVVIIQAGIYFKQSKALDAQLRVAGDALIIGNRSLISVSVESNMIEIRPIYVYLENVGRVPASDIEISVEMIGFADPKYANYPNFRPLVHETIVKNYGPVHLQPGHPQLFLSIDPSKHLSKNEITLIRQQSLPFGMRGYVTWKDGFENQPTQQTNFAFEYKVRGIIFTISGEHETEEQWIPSDPRQWNDMAQRLIRETEERISRGFTRMNTDKNWRKALA
jgi:hypothetical protein